MYMCITHTLKYTHTHINWYWSQWSSLSTIKDIIHKPLPYSHVPYFTAISQGVIYFSIEFLL